MKHIGKPCTGKPHARFDEGGQGYLPSTLCAPVTALRAMPGARTRSGAGGVTATRWRRCGGRWGRAWCFGIPSLRPCFGNCGATRRRSSAAGSTRCRTAQGRAAGGNGRGVALVTWGKTRRSGGAKKPYSANSSCRAITDTSTSLWISFTAIGISITPGQTVTSPFLIQSLATCTAVSWDNAVGWRDGRWEGRGTHCKVDKACKAESRLLFDFESPEFTYTVLHSIS